MRENQSSLTAAWVASARHFGRLLPQADRLVDDPFGATFTSFALARVIERAADPASQRPVSRALRAVAHPLARTPGLRAWILYMQVRTRVIDDAVRAFVAAGGTQIVVLGAGYDCRALRLPELAAARVFEIDHPATQRHKRHVLERLGAASPAQYLAWDFDARPMADLPAALGDIGHHRSAQTFTIWEGVTMYLADAAIDGSLRAIAAWSAPGSELAMHYFAKRRFARRSLMLGAARAIVATAGEPWRWTIDPEQIPAYLAERGFELIEDISLAAAASRLLPPELARHVHFGDRLVALASRRGHAAHRPSETGGLPHDVAREV